MPAAVGEILFGVGQGFFVPLFFINVGVSFDTSALGDPASLLNGLGILAAASLVATLIPVFLLTLVGLRLCRARFFLPHLSRYWLPWPRWDTSSASWTIA
jgi:Kef-type K+ transport system membrane component KefB